MMLLSLAPSGSSSSMFKSYPVFFTSTFLLRYILLLLWLIIFLRQFFCFISHFLLLLLILFILLHWFPLLLFLLILLTGSLSNSCSVSVRSCGSFYVLQHTRPRPKSVQDQNLNSTVQAFVSLSRVQLSII